MPVPSGSGRPDAPILIVGECWGETEERTHTPFSGASGQELNRMLGEAGILSSDCYKTNLVNARPPRNDLDAWIPIRKTAITSDMVRLRGRFVKPIVFEGYESLMKEISLLRPKLIIALGNSALWALTGRTGITKWRGSLLNFNGVRLIPTYHPAAIMRMWDWRAIAVLDLRRAARELAEPTAQPEWRLKIRPSLSDVLTRLDDLQVQAESSSQPIWLDFDIETVCGHIRCFGITWSRTAGLCIPLMLPGSDGYWLPEEEGKILWKVYSLFTHPNVRIRGQNLLYDYQYVYRHWHFIPRLGQDTMLSHHVLWAGLPKSLAFQSSIYCKHYEYWKGMVHDAEEKEGA